MVKMGAGDCGMGSWYWLLGAGASTGALFQKQLASHKLEGYLSPPAYAKETNMKLKKE